MLKYQKRAKKSFEHLMTDILNKLDLFGATPSFRIMKRAKYSTTLGLLMTLGLFTTILIYFVLELIALTKFENPSVVSSESQILESSAYPLTMQNFTFAITVVDPKLNPLKTINQHFFITLQQCVRTRILNPETQKVVITLNCTDYPLENCNSDHFITPLSSEYFSKVRFGTVQCLQKDFWKSNPPIFQGTVSGDLFQYLQIKFHECKNSSTKLDCAPRSEIQEVLKQGYYAVYLSDNLIKMDLSGVPFEGVINQQSVTFAMTSSKQIYQSLQIQQAKSDYGIISNSLQTDDSLVWYQLRESQEIYNDDYIISHIIRLDTRVKTFQRKYIKLQTIMSKIGGLWNVLFLLCSVLLKPFIDTMMNIQMVNKLFKFEQKEEANIAETRLNRLKKSFCIYRMGNSNDFHQYLKQKQVTLKFGFLDIFKIIFACKSKLKKQLDYGKEQFCKKLDVAQLVSKIYEIEKLKHILLSPEQLHLFNYIPKPTIPLNIFNEEPINIKDFDKRNAYKQILQDEKPDIMKFQEAYSAYLNLMKSDKTELDLKILSYLDQEMIQIFESVNMTSVQHDVKNSNCFELMISTQKNDEIPIFYQQYK